MRRAAEWLRVGLASASFWRRAISVTLHALAGRLLLLVAYLVFVFVYLAVFA